MTRGALVRGAVLTTVVVLVGGRWLAVTVADQMWADAVGVGAIHRQIRGVRVGLSILAFLAAAAWCLGHLALIYRSIGSVQVPRRLANLEFAEALPKRYLLPFTVVLALGLAVVVSYPAVGWWPARVLMGAGEPLGLVDPVLGRDLSYYLFLLPWQRTLHGFVTVAAVLMLAVTVLLYVAVGGLRWVDRRLEATDGTRRHLGALLACVGVVLYWGYRLEAPELVAGVVGVPMDAVLIEVRLPTARLLRALALVAASASVVWVWVPRLALPLVAWTVLGVVSVSGHYVVPALAGGARSAGLEPPASSLAETARWEAVAYGETIEHAPSTAGLGRTPSPQALGGAPVWEASAVAAALDAAFPRADFERFSEAVLSAVGGTDGERAPVFLAPRVVDFGMRPAASPAPSWEWVHSPGLAYASGVAAVAASRVGPEGHALFVADPARPDSAGREAAELRLALPDVVFAPGARDFLIAPRDRGGPIGVRANPIGPRLALAWTLQSPRLLTSSLAATPEAVVVWRRQIAERLERVVPFARFGKPYPVVARERLFWMANGYVAAKAFPMARGARWRGEPIRYLRSSLVGVVDAATGETTSYLTRDPDPLTAAWARRTRPLLQPFDSMPADLSEQVRYPQELFEVQAGLVERRLGGARRLGPKLFVGVGAPPRTGPSAHWWFGGLGADPEARLRLVAPVEVGDPPVLAAVLDGTVRDGRLALHVSRLDTAGGIPGPTLMARRMGRAPLDSGTVSGETRVLLVDGAVIGFQSRYAVPPEGPPRLVRVVASDGVVVGTGSTLAEAAERLASAAPSAAGPDARWAEVRQWFGRLEEAMRAGDWQAFGRAYEALQRLIGSKAAPR